jgi:hypothetical protein
MVQDFSLEEYVWTLPLALTLGLAFWVWRGRPMQPGDDYLILQMRAGGAIPLSLCLWLIWWLMVAL